MAPLHPSEPPRATVTPSGPVRVKVGEPINLECQASGEPRPSVTWHRLDNNRKMILSSPVPVDSNALLQVHIRVPFIFSVCCGLCLTAVLVISLFFLFYQILVARPEDSGTYICTVQNSQGRSETRVEVLIEGGTQVPTVPRAIVRDPLLVIVEGTTAVLHCDAHGKYRPYAVRIIWLKLHLSELPESWYLTVNTCAARSAIQIK